MSEPQKKRSCTVFNKIKTDLNSRQGRRQLKGEFVRYYEQQRLEQGRQKVLKEFSQILNVERPVVSNLQEDLRFYNSKDISHLEASSLLTIGSHAMTHRIFASLNYEEQVYELEESDKLLKKYCPAYYPTIAYPNGFFNKETIRIARGIYDSAFACNLGSYRNLWAYPRTGLGQYSELSYTISPLRRNYILPLKRFLHYTGIRRMC